MSSRLRRAIQFVATAVVAAPALIAAAPPVPALAAPVTLNSVYVGSVTFSPNGDGYEDELNVDWCQDAAANVDVTILDATGSAVVRRLIFGLSTPSGCYYEQHRATWDGLDSAGTAVPDGHYLVEVRAVDSGNVPAVETRPVVVDRRIPGVWTSPLAAATLSGTAVSTFQPTAGFDGITQVDMWVACQYTQGTLAADGVYRAEFDTQPCGEGPSSAGVTVHWTDSLGYGHLYTPQYRSIALSNPVPPVPRIVGSGPRYYAPGLDGSGEAVPVTVCVSEAVTANVRVLDSTGAVVRTLATDAHLNGNSSCTGSWYWYDYLSVPWNGLDDAGQPAPDGAYSLDVDVVDSDGLVGVTTQQIGLDRREVGMWVQPTENAHVVGTTEVVFQPTPGFGAISEVTASVACGYSPLTLQADGAYHGEFDTVPCGEGPASAALNVRWSDPFGSIHSWNPVRQIQLDNPVAPVVEILTSPTSFSPDADSFEDTLSTAFCVDEHVVASVDVIDESGAAVRSLMSEASVEGDSSCGQNAWWVPRTWITWDGLTDGSVPAPDGRYTIRVTVTDDSGLGSTDTIETIVDRRALGTWLSPASDASVAGTVDVTFQPAPGRTDISVSAAIACVSGGVSGPAADGLSHVELDTTSCGEGPTTASMWLSWSDAFGGSHVYSFPSRLVTLANLVAPVARINSTPRFFSPNNDGFEDGFDFSVCASENVTATVTVRDEGGATVRTLLPSVALAGNNYCTYWWWYGPSLAQSWDGLDDQGLPAPDGQYQIFMSTTDSTGLTSTTTLAAGIDRRSPGSLVSPSAGSTMAGFAPIVFTPTAGFEVNRVDFWFATSGSIYNASPDGTWKTSIPVGSLVAGPSEFSHSVSYTDALGYTHNWQPTSFQVAIDPAAIPLSASLVENSGLAPFDASLTLEASDGQGRPLDFEVRWGDGSATVTATSAAPYSPLTLAHRFTTPGTYQVFISVTNHEGGYASLIRTVSVTGIVNTPPSAVMNVTPSSGAAPLDIVVNVGGSDPQNDPLTARIDFGDGSPIETRPVPVAGATHRYSAPGVYLVRAEVSDGELSTIKTQLVNVVLAEPLVAAAGDDQQSIEGQVVNFSGAASRPGGMIGSYSWDFGDGSSATGSDASHAYSVPGIYTVTLTIAAGNASATDTALITVVPVPPEPGLSVHVTSSGSPVAGAEATVILPSGQRVSALTNGAGLARLTGLADGPVTVYVWSDGLQPEAASATLTNGAGSVDVQLVSGDIGAATVESKRLTLDEIIARGVDVADPVNTNVYEATINLYFEPITEGGSGPVPHPLPWTIPDILLIGSRVECDVECQGQLEPQPPSSDCDVTDPAGPCFLLGGYQFYPEVTYVEQKPLIQWLVIPVKASWLKEFFDVKLIVQNLTGAFAFSEGSATIDLPAGLSLAPTATPQSTTQSVSPIPAGGGRTVSWTVRGDAEGSYDVSASYTATVEPLGRVVRLAAATRDPLKVWGGSALEMTVTVDSTITRWAPYEVVVRLDNVSDVPVYNAAIELFENPDNQSDTQADYFFTPLTVPQVTASVIPPGGHLESSFAIMAGVGSEEIPNLKLVLSESFIAQTGGNVTIATHLGEKPSRLYAGDSFGNLSVTTQQGEAGQPDNAHLRWTNLAGEPGNPVTGYDVYARDAAKAGGGWRMVGSAPPNSSGFVEYDVPSTRRDVGRYFTVVTRYADGTVLPRHNLGVGPARYVAMGDSFSAGEGTPAFFTGTAKDVSPVPVELMERYPYDNVCHRSVGAYSQLLVADRSVTAPLEPVNFVACSGAVTRDLEEPNPRNEGEDAQLDALSDFTDEVTISIGGNDAGFADVAAMCAAADCDLLLGPAELSANNAFLNRVGVVFDSFMDLKQQLLDIVKYALKCVPPLAAFQAFQCGMGAKGTWSNITSFAQYDTDRQGSPRNVFNGTLENRLLRVLQEVQERAPNARILVVPYPKVLDQGPDNVTCSLTPFAGLSLTSSERAMLIRFTNLINSQIKDAVRQVNDGNYGHQDLEYVEVDPYFAGKQLCGPDGHLNPNTGFNTLVNDYFSWPGNYGPYTYSLHPNAFGQQAYAAAVKAALGPAKQTRSNLTASTPIASTSANVPSGRTTLNVTTLWNGPDVTTTLVSPSGTTYDVGSGGVTVTSGAGNQTLSISDPQPGQWTVRVQGGSSAQSVVTRSWTTSPISSVPVARGSLEILDRATGLLHLSDAGSSDADGTIVAYRWHLPDGRILEGSNVDASIGVGAQTFVTLEVVDSSGDVGYVDLLVDDLRPPNQPPSAVDDSVTTDEDTPLALSLLSNDSDPDADPLVISAVTQPTHGSVTLDVTGAAQFVPQLNWAGTDEFTYTVSDGRGGTSTAHVAVQVRPVNDPPLLAPVEMTIGETLTASGTIVGSDADGDPLTYHYVSPPAHGAASIDAAGAWTYSSSVPFDGDDVFNVSVDDGHGGLAQTIITVHRVSGLTSLEASPATSEVTIGQTSSLIATGSGPSAGPVDVTSSATWSSSDSNVALVVGGVITPIAPGTVTVTATLGSLSSSVQVTVRPQPSPPSAPSGVTATAVADGIRLEWSHESTDEINFEVWRLLVDPVAGAAQTDRVFTVPSGSAAVVDPLSGRGSYVYVVRAVNLAGSSAWGVSGLVDFGYSAPPAPSSLSTQSGSGGIQLNWVPGGDPGDGFEVWRLRVDSTTGSSEVASSITVYTPSLFDVPDSSGTYVYVVRSVNRFGASGWAVSGVVTYANVPPAAPDTLSVSTSTGGVDLSWSDRSSIETGFEVWRLRVNQSTGASTVEATFTTSTNATSFHDTPAPGDVVYVVRAVNDFGASDWAVSGVVAFANDPPSAPTSVTASVGSDAIDVSWTDTSATEMQFELWRLRVDPATGATVVAATVSLAPDSHSYYDVVSSSGVYVYVVRASNGFGASAWAVGDPVTVEVQAPTSHLGEPPRWSAQTHGLRAPVTAATDAGNVITASNFAGTIQAGGNSLVSHGGADVAIVGYGPDGQVQWTRGLGGTGDDVPHAQVAVAGGPVVTVGTFTGTVDFGGGTTLVAPTNSFGSSDMFLTGTNPTNGSPMWSRRLGLNGFFCESPSAGLGPNGSVIVTGGYYGTLDAGTGVFPSGSTCDGFVASYSAASGDLLWLRHFEAGGHIQPNSVSTSEDGTIAITGSFQGSTDLGSGVIASGGFFSLFVAVLGSDGTTQWAKAVTANGSLGAHFSGDVLNFGGHVFVASYFGSSTTDFGGGLVFDPANGGVTISSWSASDGALQWVRQWSIDTQQTLSLERHGAAGVLLVGGTRSPLDLGAGVINPGNVWGVFAAIISPEIRDVHRFADAHRPLGWLCDVHSDPADGDIALGFTTGGVYQLVGTSMPEGATVAVLPT